MFFYSLSRASGCPMMGYIHVRMSSCLSTPFFAGVCLFIRLTIHLARSELELGAVVRSARYSAAPYLHDTCTRRAVLVFFRNNVDTHTPHNLFALKRV